MRYIVSKERGATSLSEKGYNGICILKKNAW